MAGHPSAGPGRRPEQFFPPVRFGGKTLVPGQGNNLYIFPAVGLAIVATKAQRVTDEMFVVAARAVADQVTQAELDSGLLHGRG